MPFKKGQSENPAGRRRGSLNKTTLAVETALLAAFDELGGRPWLVELGRSAPRSLSALLGWLIPAEISAAMALEQRGPASRPSMGTTTGSRLKRPPKGQIRRRA